MSKTNRPQFKIYSKLGLRLTEHPKVSSGKLGSKKWQALHSGLKRPSKDTEYGAMLSGKQRLNVFYGQIKEKQFHNLYLTAKTYEGNQTINFIKLLERRLDVILFRAKISPSFREIRQLIQHGHVTVNNNIVKTSSILLNKNDYFSFKETSLAFIKSISNRNYLEIPHNTDSVLKKKDTSFIKTMSRYKGNKLIVKTVLKKRVSEKTNKTAFTRLNISDSNFTLLKRLRQFKLTGVEEATTLYPIYFIPNYIEFNFNLMVGKLIGLPTETNIFFTMNPKLTSIMEYYKYKKKS